jgi:actin-related protein
VQPTTVLNSQSSKLALAGRQPLKTPVVQADREQLTQLAFEEFNMTGFFLCDQPVLSLYSVGKITGTVVDLGHCKTGMFLC